MFVLKVYCLMMRSVNLGVRESFTRVFKKTGFIYLCMCIVFFLKEICYFDYLPTYRALSRNVFAQKSKYASNAHRQI